MQGTITVMQYEYPDTNWEIGQILETAGSTSYYIVVDQKKRSLQLLANGDGEDYAYEY